MAMEILFPTQGDMEQSPWEDCDGCRICDGCGEAILGGESYFLLPDGYLFCENCMSDMRHTV